MPIDPYAALHALLRAEAVRNAPHPHPTPAPVKAQTEDEEAHHQEKPGQADR
ncbi:hypothetical protein ABZ916_28150 [Streptomyces sp. NPDC046853]|uniref:hypothetical protein n=1 Tax=Streptomyces sp. NPDC046853 TaxID=3154920 RepID=UPI0033C85D18